MPRCTRSDISGLRCRLWFTESSFILRSSVCRRLERVVLTPGSSCYQMRETTKESALNHVFDGETRLHASSKLR